MTRKTTHITISHETLWGSIIMDAFSVAALIGFFAWAKWFGSDAAAWFGAALLLATLFGILVSPRRMTIDEARALLRRIEAEDK